MKYCIEFAKNFEYMDEIDDLDLEKLGSKFENDSIFPER